MSQAAHSIKKIRVGLCAVQHHRVYIIIHTRIHTARGRRKATKFEEHDKRTHITRKIYGGLNFYFHFYIYFFFSLFENCFLMWFHIYCRRRQDGKKWLASALQRFLFAYATQRRLNFWCWWHQSHLCSTFSRRSLSLSLCISHSFRSHRISIHIKKWFTPNWQLHWENSSVSQSSSSVNAFKICMHVSMGVGVLVLQPFIRATSKI